MATFIELIKTTRLLCGMQGTGPSTISGVQGIEEVLVRFVRDAYVEIQNIREEWRWMEDSGSFSTVASKDTYTLLEVFFAPTPQFKKYQKDSFIITDGYNKKTYLQFSPRNVLEARYLNDDLEKLPIRYTIDPPSNDLILKPIPDGVYNVDFRYQRSPEILSADIQVPTLPLPFHNLIIYKAVEKMAVYLSSPETYRQYSLEAAKMLGQLMRLEVPKMRMTAGALV